MLTDIEIAQQAKMQEIKDVAKKLNIQEDDLEYYGNYKAKIKDSLLKKIKDYPDGRLILVTAITPTPAGEGKTTVTVGLGQAMQRIGCKASIALREPSLGPVMGIKGGAAGGGYAQVIPMEDINLHFTGDMHAITSSHNLLSAIIDNHIQQGNTLKIDVRRIIWKRVLDMNDRALRNIIIGLGGKVNGSPREDGFMITVASEIMAILCLSEDLDTLKEGLAKIIVAYTYDNEPITVKDLKVEGAMALLLKDAIKPNLVQTLENTPCFMHGGPFANIAHGCNSLIATKTALKLSDYVITEAGFGADLGGEKFLDIKCKYGKIKPDAVVIVATVRALKYSGGLGKEDLTNENLDALSKGIVNLEKHIENIKEFQLPVVVCINHFAGDTEDEISYIKNFCKKMGVECALADVFSKGSQGGIDLANKLLDTIKNSKGNFKFLYKDNLSIKEKIHTIVTKIYGGKNVTYTRGAENDIKQINQLGYSHLPICMAKTQYSLSDDPKLLGRPEGFTVTVREVNISAGAGFIVAITGNIMTMPGLPKQPAAENINIDKNGNISGLF